MIIDFSAIGVVKEQPVLVLKNADGTPLQTLGYAHNLNAEIHYNGVSTITFDLPAYVDGVKTPHYDDVKGLRIIDMVGWGQFILVNPKTSNDGIREIKNCKAYSLEYELTYKTVYIPDMDEAPINLETISSLILEAAPEWDIVIPSDLYTRYRSFSEEKSNVYDFITSVQKTLNCIFDFDTYNRVMYVRDAEDEAVTRPVYISLDNLAKEIEIEEDSEHIVTVLDVNGSEDVDIRMVNPIGNNKIYNLDYFMNTSHFDAETIAKWNAWKAKMATAQTSYYNISIELAMKTAAIIAEETAINEMKEKDLGELESTRAVYVEYLARLQDKTSAEYTNYKNLLDQTNTSIANMNTQIASKVAALETLYDEKEALVAELSEIKEDVAFTNTENFTEEMYTAISRYFKEDSIDEPSFVLKNVESYSEDSYSGKDEYTSTNSGIIDSIDSTSVAFTNSDISSASSVGGDTLHIIRGGSISCAISGSTVLSAKVISASAQIGDNEYIITARIGAGTIGAVAFNNACMTIKGSGSANETAGTSSLVITTCADGTLFFTRDTTEYDRYSVELDLYEYGVTCLEALAYPTYTFSVDSANFFTLDEFSSFVSSITLGDRIYLNTGEDVLEPFCVGVTIDFEEPSNLALLFSDSYSASDKAFELVDILEDSISMGKTLSSNKVNYSSFVNSGASSAVKRFMQSALDVAKNRVLSGSGQGIMWDESGLHLRKYNDPSDTSAGYEDEQIWMINNTIAFTDDGWQTVKMALGKIIDESIKHYSLNTSTVYDSDETYYVRSGNATTGYVYTRWDGDADDWADRPTLYVESSDHTGYGVAAPYLVGTLLAGQNLSIDTENGSFRVDPTGVYVDALNFQILRDGSTSTLQSTLENITSINNTLSNVIDENGYLDASELAGVINAQSAVMQDATGNVLFDGDGMWLLNSTSKSTATKAIVMNEQGILFGSGTATDDPLDEDSGWTWTTAISHDGIISDAMATKTLSAFTINGGSIKIGGTDTEPAFYVDTNGNLTANSGTFSGTISSPTLSGNLVTDGDAWLLGAGLSVGGNPTTSSGNFYVDTDGNVTMAGSLDLSSTSSINWGNNAPIKMQFSANGSTWHNPPMTSSDYYRRDWDYSSNAWGSSYKFRGTDGSTPSLPSYIKREYIDFTQVTATQVESPYLFGGSVYATGTGDSAGENPAFYISDGVTTQSSGIKKPNAPLGWISYDTNGDDTPSSAQNRVFFHTETNIPIKIESGGNMSIEANGKIYIPSPIQTNNIIIVGSLCFGSDDPEDRTESVFVNPTQGQVYFKI